MQFEILSASQAPLHASRVHQGGDTINQKRAIMQNEPNLHRGKNESNPIHKKGLREFYTPSDNEKRTQNEPNFKIGKMNLNPVKTMAYINIRLCSRGKNKPNSNPIQAKTNPKQTQNKPNSNPNKPNSNPISKAKKRRLHLTNPRKMGWNWLYDWGIMRIRSYGGCAETEQKISQ